MEDKNQQNSKTSSLFDQIQVPRSYFTVSQSKLAISKVIKEATDDDKEQGSLRNLAKRLKELYGDEIKTPHYNTIQRITSGEDYTIENLLMLLDLLGKKIVIVDRTEEENEFINRRGKIEL